MKTTTKLKRSAWLISLGLATAACQDSGQFPDQEDLCQFDQQRENSRAASAAQFPNPVIFAISVNGTTVWDTNNPTTVPTLPQRWAIGRAVSAHHDHGGLCPVQCGRPV